MHPIGWHRRGQSVCLKQIHIHSSNAISVSVKHHSALRRQRSATNGLSKAGFCWVKHWWIVRQERDRVVQAFATVLLIHECSTIPGILDCLTWTLTGICIRGMISFPYYMHYFIRMHDKLIRGICLKYCRSSQLNTSLHCTFWKSSMRRIFYINMELVF